MYDKRVVAKERHAQHAKQREFVEGDLILVRTFNIWEKSIAGIVQKKSGPVHVKLSNGQIIRRHFDHGYKRWPVIGANNANISDINPVADGNEPSTAMEKVPEDIPNDHSDQPAATTSQSTNIGPTPPEPEPLGEPVTRYLCKQHTRSQYLKDCHV